MLDEINHSRRNMQRRAAFRYTPGLFEKTNGRDGEHEDTVDGSPVSPVPLYLPKTSSSEWNSSDDLTGPFSEQEEPQIFHPPLPPKPMSLSGIPTLPRNGYTPTSLRRWIETPSEHRLSSDASSKSSDQDRNDLSASESDERSPSIGGREGSDSPTLTERGLPTTYFSVDNCMTDTYRAKYHKKPYLKAEDHTSSGESDLEGRTGTAADVKTLDMTKNRAEAGYSTKTLVKWKPVTSKGLDEHGFL